jgi:hypothetical protein
MLLTLRTVTLKLVDSRFGYADSRRMAQRVAAQRVATMLGTCFGIKKRADFKFFDIIVSGLPHRYLQLVRAGFLNRCVVMLVVGG